MTSAAAFIPYNLLPHLRWLREPEYTHVYYVDLKPKVTDVRSLSDDSNHPNGSGYHPYWRACGKPGRREVRGFRRTLMATAAWSRLKEVPASQPLDLPLRVLRARHNRANDPVFLGEFTDDDLNFTTSYPAILCRLRSQQGVSRNPEDDESYAIVGVRPTTCDGEGAANGYLMVYDLNTMQQVQTKRQPPKVRLPGRSHKPLNINLNYNTEVMYIGKRKTPAHWERCTT